VRKSATFLFGLIAAAIGWVFFQNFEFKGLEDFEVVPRAPGEGELAEGGGLASLPPAKQTGTIRIASFNIQVFGTSKSSKPMVMDILARIVRNFDVVAIQEIRSKDQDIIPNFVELINSAGRHYDYVIGPRLGRTSSKEQYAFIYDVTTIEIDRSQLYTVEDPDDLLHREPLVGWFRVRGPAAEQAFTFSLVNIHTDPDETDIELNALDDVFRVVRDDGRQEDDVILLGDLNVDDRHLGELGQISGISWVISGTPTNTRGTAQYDNIVFHSQATREFTGRGGIFDFLRQYNLSIEEALEVSDHLPVWAEFSSYEGGQPGRIASGPSDTTR
jgi:endonuclease/exonuclease/phosphatase family metal-dependent hydrolase